MDLRSTGNVDPEDSGSNPSTEPSMGELIERRLGRRAALRGLVGAGAAAALAHELLGSSALAQPTGPSTLTFKEVAHGLDKTQHVPEGYEAQVLIRWGDPVVAGAPAFDPEQPDGRRAGKAVRLQLRLHRPASAARRQHDGRSLPHGREPRIHRSRPDVRRPGLGP